MNKQLLVGLPATGKTTFLAALWHVVESEEIPDSLRLERLEGDREYLNSIREEWLTYQEVRRTPRGSAELVYMRLEDPQSRATTDLYLPDLAGEIFEEQWIQRRWDAEFAENTAGATGILLFVHPNEVRDPTTIREVAAIPAVQAIDEDAEAQQEEVALAWRPEDAPTQVQLVDLLQFLTRELAGSSPIRLAVIISAWDIVLRQLRGVTPDLWINRRLPLLSQFLSTNPDVFETRIYGISAQGGDLKRDRDALLDKDIPAHRIIVQHGEATSHDITGPIRWIMEGEQV